jgi:hypothetical protein
MALESGKFDEDELHWKIILRLRTYVSHVSLHNLVHSGSNYSDCFRVLKLGIRGMHNVGEQAGGTSVLREPSEAYGHKFAGENDVLRLENTILWDESAAVAET